MLTLGRHRLAFDRPRVMGVLNVTPDSFSDGGRFLDRDAALEHARRMLADGADILDIGGESTRPGAAPTGEADEIARVIPLVEALRAECDARGVPLCIDTRKPAVMRAAIAAGATLVNDVAALAAPGALETVAASGAAVCLMHMRGEPATMQKSPHYDDVVAEVKDFLAGRATACERAGIAADRIVLDPGFGFGKTNEHNFELLARLEELAEIGRPLLVGISRKGMLKHATGRSVGDRLVGSVAAALIAVERGARIVRVHDVAATRDALAVWQTMREQMKGQA